jgi:hypothetical protein
MTDTTTLYIEKIDIEVAKKMIVKNHYSHTIGFGISLALGLFQPDKPDPFFERIEGKLMGCIVFCVPVGAQVHKGISPLVTSQDEVFELTRLWVSDELGKNTESWFISQSFKYLKRHYPNIKTLISYSDTEQQHLGTIYQATNWIYQGEFFHGDMLYSFDEGKSWRHNKGLRNVYGATTHNELLSVLPRPFWYKQTSPKHRYLYLLGDRNTNRRIFKTLKHSPQPYPDSCEYTEAITKVDKELVVNESNVSAWFN